MAVRPPSTGDRPPRDATPPRFGRTAPRPVSLEVPPDEPPEHLFRRLLGAYLGGASSIRIRGTPEADESTRAIVRSFCRRTDGVTIGRTGSAEILLAVEEEGRATTLRPRLREMGSHVLAFHRAAVRSWSGLPLEPESSWERSDDLLDREAWRLQREATRQIVGGGDAVDALGVWTVARCLERIADHAVAIGELGGRLAALPSGSGTITSLAQFHRQAMEHLEGVLAADDDTAANDQLDTGEALLASGRTLVGQLLPAVNDGSMAPATAAAVGQILESIGRTIAYAQDIAQVPLDRSARASTPLLAPRPEVILTAP